MLYYHPALLKMTMWWRWRSNGGANCNSIRHNIIRSSTKSKIIQIVLLVGVLFRRASMVVTIHRKKKRETTLSFGRDGRRSNTIIPQHRDRDILLLLFCSSSPLPYSSFRFCCCYCCCLLLLLMLCLHRRRFCFILSSPLLVVFIWSLYCTVCILIDVFIWFLLRRIVR